MKTPRTHLPKTPGAFTLVELVVSIALIGLLVGMVFTTARSSLELGNSVVKTQSEEMLHQAFFELLEKRFSSLPGNTRLDLKVTDTSSHYLSDLTLEEVPMSFNWGGAERTAKAIQISTILRRSGYLDIVLRYYENPIIDPSSNPTTSSSFRSTATDEAPFAEIILLSDLRYFEWRVLDGNQMEYEYEWDLPGRLPLQLELTCAFGAEGPPIRHVFWIPPRQNPEVFMRQLQQGGGGRIPGGNPNQPEIEISIPEIPPSGGGTILPNPTE
jgi:type II secretory pathway pseudopilin PulG